MAPRRHHALYCRRNAITTRLRRPRCGVRADCLTGRIANFINGELGTCGTGLAALGDDLPAAGPIPPQANCIRHCWKGCCCSQIFALSRREAVRRATVTCPVYPYRLRHRAHHRQLFREPDVPGLSPAASRWASCFPSMVIGGAWLILRTRPERLDRFRRANAALTPQDPFRDFTTSPEITQVFGEIIDLGGSDGS